MGIPDWPSPFSSLGASPLPFHALASSAGSGGNRRAVGRGSTEAIRDPPTATERSAALNAETLKETSQTQTFFTRRLSVCRGGEEKQSLPDPALELMIPVESPVKIDTARNLRSPDCVSPPCTPRGRAFTRGDPRGPLRSPDCVTPPCTPRGRAFTRGDPRGPLRSPDCVTPPCTPRGRAFTRGDPRGPLRSPDCVTPPCTPCGRAFTRGDPRGPLHSPDCVIPPCTPCGRAFTRGDPRGPPISPDCETPLTAFDVHDLRELSDLLC
ncbi:UNVERIFIED_CONTAM: hypothetical protein FKN15_021594 [Acipenser sinensis]